MQWSTVWSWRKAPRTRNRGSAWCIRLKSTWRISGSRTGSWRSSLRGPIISMRNWPWILIFWGIISRICMRTIKKFLDLMRKSPRSFVSVLENQRKNSPNDFFINFLFFFSKNKLNLLSLFLLKVFIHRFL